MHEEKVERGEGGVSGGREGDNCVDRGKGDEMDLAQHLAAGNRATQLRSLDPSL
jgi:hypothetical protein